MTDSEASVVATWKEAAADLGIRFTSPFTVRSADGICQKHLGLVHQFGRRIGTLIAVMDQPSLHIPHPTPAGDDYFWSILAPCYERYERQLFIDTLNDWAFFGPDGEKPEWYSGPSWR